ncbi:MAG: histidinol-phosphate aminotransferase family protein [Lachnospiraceae bacterium]|nr:histidinol-phosphate aminotransferase family protein [Lachnospiraceae bacterium]
MLYVNESIKNTIRVLPAPGRYDYYRYDMNENPEGLPKEFVDAVLKEITPEFLATYPEPNAFLNAYAKFIGVSYENVLATNGSDMAIRYILETFGEKGKNVVTVAPSFEMYGVNCQILGLIHKPVSYESDMTIRIDKIIEAINSDTRIVVLLNPNNPIGNTYTKEELEQVLKQADKAGAIVIIDEAYHYFYDQTFLSYALERQNVIVLRTFSKLFSLAACRLGVIISHPDVIRYVQNAKLTFDVNSIALLMGTRILEQPLMIENLIAQEKEGKAFTLKSLNQYGYETRDCKGNFIFIKTNKSPQAVQQELKERYKILVKTYGPGLLESYLRLSIGSIHAMKIFLKAFYSVDSKN